jgi:hypothetical protein
MPFARSLTFAMMVGLAAAATAQPAAAPAGEVPSVVGALQPGLWHVRMLDGSKEPERDICIADPMALLQLRHAAHSCDRFVVANEEKRAIVSYTCPGAGGGRTTLRHETATAVQIDSQGIADKEPFAFLAEARRTGECGAAPAKPAGAPMPAR